MGERSLGAFRLVQAKKAALSSITLSAIALGCAFETTTAPPPSGDAGTGGTSAVGGTGGGSSGSGGTIMAGGVGGSIVIGGTGGTGGGLPTPVSGLQPPGIGTPPAPACGEVSDPLGMAVFCDQTVWNVAPAHRVLYSWTTAEQEAELRSDHILLTRTETPGLGRGYAFTAIDALAAAGTGPENTLLARLSNELFTKVRYAWPHAWATRMGWPGEDYGDRLIRIVLKPEAWIVVVSDRVGMTVIDLENNVVPIEEALAHSERIGAVYFYKKDVTGNGSFESCSGGYREFIVGNEAMIEEWSLGTPEIRDQLAADKARLETFFEIVREKPPAVAPSSFNQTVVCQWDYPAHDEADVYERCLAIPSEYYAPLPAELSALIETLEASTFEPDPLIVKAGG